MYQNYISPFTGPRTRPQTGKTNTKSLQLTTKNATRKPQKRERQEMLMNQQQGRETAETNEQQRRGQARAPLILRHQPRPPSRMRTRCRCADVFLTLSFLLSLSLWVQVCVCVYICMICICICICIYIPRRAPAPRPTGVLLQCHKSFASAVPEPYRYRCHNRRPRGAICHFQRGPTGLQLPQFVHPASVRRSRRAGWPGMP